MFYFVIIIFLSLSCRINECKKYRLSTTVRPSLYSIRLQPDIDREVFSGSVYIYIKVLNSIESIELHSGDLNVTSIYLNTRRVEYVPDNFNSSICNTSLGFRFVDNELIQIKPLNNDLVLPGNYIIFIQYEGQFSNSTVGLFKTSYTKNEEKVSYLIATDFEPTHARTAFPCFDEPAFKARFKLTLMVPNDTYTAISNMDVKNVFHTTQGVVYKFKTTKIMSPYLLAFVITQYTYGSYRNKIGMPIRIYSVNASMENNTEIMKFTDEVLTLFSRYTCYSYPLSKIDMVEFDRTESAATENWGLITLRTGLLSPENDLFDLNQIFDVIAHEVAHFWFGNLVTVAWWDDLWLQEGFAVFMSLKAQEYVLKNNASYDFTFQYVEDIYRMELNISSKPIINFQMDPELIKNNFNEITYVKGAALLRMIENVLGPNRFQNVIICYIGQYAFKSASTDDFLNVLENMEPNADFREFVESYLYNQQYPVIQVSEEKDAYILKQSSCGYYTDNSLRQKWTIPITYTTSSNTTQHLVWFDKDKESLIIKKGDETWIKLNYGQIGLYRVNYSVSLWDKFMIHNQELEPSERDHLLLEAVGLYEAGLLSCEVALRYLKELSNVTDTLKLNMKYTFIAFEKLREIEEFDQDAGYLLENYFQKILFSAGHREIVVKIWMRNAGKHGSAASVPARVKLCIQWIKGNLSDNQQR